MNKLFKPLMPAGDMGLMENNNQEFTQEFIFEVYMDLGIAVFYFFIDDECRFRVIVIDEDNTCEEQIYYLSCLSSLGATPNCLIADTLASGAVNQDGASVLEIGVVHFEDGKDVERFSSIFVKVYSRCLELMCNA